MLEAGIWFTPPRFIKKFLAAEIMEATSKSAGIRAVLPEFATSPDLLDAERHTPSWV